MQHFEVIKINRRGKRQFRLIGIDGYNIYNDVRPGANPEQIAQESLQKKSSFIKSVKNKIFQVKNKQRPINTICEVKKLDKRAFIITFLEKNGDKKTIQYECKNEDNTAEIIAKLKFLRKNKDTPLT